ARGRRGQRDRAPDRQRLSRPARGELAAHAHRIRGTRLLHRRAGGRRRPDRVWRAASARAVDGVRSPRAVRIAPLLAGRAGPPGAGQAMSGDILADKNRRLVRILLTIMGVLALAGLLAGIRWERRPSSRRRRPYVAVPTAPCRRRPPPPVEARAA